MQIQSKLLGRNCAVTLWCHAQVLWKHTQQLEPNPVASSGLDIVGTLTSATIAITPLPQIAGWIEFGGLTKFELIAFNSYIWTMGSKEVQYPGWLKHLHLLASWCWFHGGLVACCVSLCSK